jgi:hypothetical protein
MPDSWTLSFVSSNCALVKVLPIFMRLAAGGKPVPLKGKHIPGSHLPE